MLSAICCHMTREWASGRRAVPHIRTLRQLPELDRAVFFLAWVPGFNAWVTSTAWN